MVGLELAGQALEFISTTLNFVKDSRLYNKKKEYVKLLKSLRAAEGMNDEDKDDNMVDHLRIELIDFLSVWSNEIQAYSMAKEGVASVQSKGN